MRFSNFTGLMGLVLSACSAQEIQTAQTDLTSAQTTAQFLCQTAEADAAVFAPGSVAQVSGICAAAVVGGAIAQTDLQLLQSIEAAKTAAASKK